MIYRIVSEVSQYKVAFKNLGSVFEKKSHAFVLHKIIVFTVFLIIVVMI